MAGLMGVTAFLSMWINNSAATSIMIPAAIAIVDEFENYQRKKQEKHSTTDKIDDHHQSQEVVSLESTSMSLFLILKTRDEYREHCFLKSYLIFINVQMSNGNKFQPSSNMLHEIQME